MRGFIFTQKVVNRWNSLPKRIEETRSLSVFKTQIDGFMNRWGIKGYGVSAGDSDIEVIDQPQSLLNGGRGACI